MLVPRRHRPNPGVHLHVCRRLDSRDVTEHLGIPVTTVARMLVDLSDRLTAEELANLIHEAASGAPMKVLAALARSAASPGPTAASSRA